MLAFSTTIIAFFAVFANLASGSPVPEPQPQPSQNPCSPSFQGVATYIQAYDTYNRLWVPAGSQQSTVISTLSGGQTRWRVEGTGSANNDYHIKYITPANNLQMQTWRGGSVALGAVGNANEPAFRVSCNSCYPPGTIPSAGTFIGNTCYIINSNSGLYLTETAQSGGKGTAALKPRNGNTNQFFHIVAA